MTDGRANNLDELLVILGKLFTKEGVNKGLAFQPRSDDVIISPYSKCGTTWAQQIAHGLRTRGAMEFEEITEVVPWIEAAHDLGLNPNAEQVANPRLYKSHLPFDLIPQGCRYICVLREPSDALLSLYNFFDGWLIESGAISLEDFARHHVLARKPPAGYWHHLVSWYQQRDNPAVLLLCYEHLKSDFDSQLQRIAGFLQIDMDEELRAIVTRQSSLAFMREHNSQFDDHYLHDRRHPAMGLPLHSTSSKVSKGVSGAGKQRIAAPLQQQLDQRWRDVVTSALGIDSYAELLGTLK